MAVGRAGLAASGLVTMAVCPTYPVEAYVALADSVQSDALDARCVLLTPGARACWCAIEHATYYARLVAMAR